jgi:hypothetical protein
MTGVNGRESWEGTVVWFDGSCTIISLSLSDVAPPRSLPRRRSAHDETPPISMARFVRCRFGLLLPKGLVSSLGEDAGDRAAEGLPRHQTETDT